MCYTAEIYKDFMKYVKGALELPPNERTETQKLAIEYAEIRAKEQNQLNQIFSLLDQLIEQLPPDASFVLSTK